MLSRIKCRTWQFIAVSLLAVTGCFESDAGAMTLDQVSDGIRTATSADLILPQLGLVSYPDTDRSAPASTSDRRLLAVQTSIPEAELYEIKWQNAERLWKLIESVWIPNPFFIYIRADDSWDRLGFYGLLYGLPSRPFLYGITPEPGVVIPAIDTLKTQMADVLQSRNVELHVRNKRAGGG